MREYSHHPRNSIDDWGWRDLTEGVKVIVHWLSGTHYTLLSEAIAPLVASVLANAASDMVIQCVSCDESESDQATGEVDCKWVMCTPEDALKKASSEAQHDIELPRIHAITLDTLLDSMSHAGAQVDADVSFAQAGVSSLQAVRVRNALQSSVGTDVILPVTLLFEHTSVRKVMTFVDGRRMLRREESNPQLSHPEASTPPHHATWVYGASCKLPGGTEWLSSLQQVAQSGFDVSTEKKDNGSLGYVLHRPEFFDRRHFSIAANEAANIDPQQRQVLEQSYTALHSSGAVKAALYGSNLGVAVGIWNTDFATIQFDAARFTVYNHLNISISVASGRVSFVLGLHGPCTTIDTACSSSLVASHSAVRALQHDECKQHLVTGVNMILMNPKLSNTSEPSVLASAMGRCHSFDQRADGYARAEACSGVVLHKSDALSSLRGAINGIGKPHLSDCITHANNSCRS